MEQTDQGVTETAPIEFTNVRPADKKSGYQKEKEKYRFTVQIATVILSNAPDKFYEVDEQIINRQTKKRGEGGCLATLQPIWKK